MEKGEKIPKVSPAILSDPYVKHLQEVIEKILLELRSSKKRIEELEQEIAKLKKVPSKPVIKPSELDKEKPDDTNKEKQKRAGSEKRKKKKNLPIDETRKVKAKEVPKGWRLVGYKPYVVQDIIIRRNNIKYEREVWESPDGHQRITAELPLGIASRDFGEQIRRYVINLYNECHVTQPIIHSHLLNLGVDISAGTVNFILNEDKANEVFGKELLEVVEAGIAQSQEIRTDDTGARHKGKNGFCNCINTDLFTYFVSTYSKSRINFLSILQVKHKDYHLNEVALSYFETQQLSPKYMDVLSLHQGIILDSEEALSQFLENLKFTAKYAVRIITEGLMIGSLVAHGFDQNKVIHSDGARQFNLFNHALCWKHAERPLVKLRFHNDIQQKQWEEKMDAFWQLYRDLKEYKILDAVQQNEQKPKLEEQFRLLCKRVENFEGLNNVLEILNNKKQELLMVLEYSFTSLHNNTTEGQIREFAKRRKISGSTRSDKGRKSRDVFTSLKKTCKKLGVPFWDYLLDRIKGEFKIPPLVDILSKRSEIALNS